MALDVGIPPRGWTGEAYRGHIMWDELFSGVDLHARFMYLCILDHAGKVVLHKNLPARPEPFLKAIAP
ncbi:MAG: hypothetical protein GF330_12975, partial [Candidatus Eisenbacteria bacterium]|nr:hypothetical protein [Candidatus Eisenbacteria bacterium]